MRSRYLVLILIVLACLPTTPARAATVQEQFKAAQKFQKEKKYDQAIEAYGQVVSMLKKAGNLPVAQQIQSNIGVLYFVQAKYREALEAYQAALDLHKKPKPAFKVKLLRNLASAHHELGHYAQAAELRERVLADKALKPQLKPRVWAELAAAYRAGGIYSEAVRAYTHALAGEDLSKPTKYQARLLTALGLCRAKLGRYPEAIEDLTRARDLALGLGEPRAGAEAHSNLGLVLWDMGRYGPALVELEKALAIEEQAGLRENQGADHNNRGLVFKSAGRPKQAFEEVEKAVLIARELKLPKDEAIALANRALLHRILDRPEEARADYQAALGMYEKVGFQEGSASCALGLGKLAEVVDRNYERAFELYSKALEIYRRLEMYGYQAEALNQIGRVLKKGINPARTTRDLIFTDDEPVFIDLPPKEAAVRSAAAYDEALRLGRLTGRSEVVWSALQGLGFALQAQGRLEESLARYDEAVSTVMNIQGSGSDSALMGDYLKDKEDLFTEAIEAAAAVYKKTKNPKYLKRQMEFQEIYKNEVMKMASASARPVFQDGQKADMFNRLTEAGARKRKLTDQAGRLNAARERAGADKSGEGAAKKKNLADEAARVKSEIKKLDRTYHQLLAEWKKKYPSDAALFDSAAKVDLNRIQAGLGPDEALIQYFPLSEFLSIVAVTKEEVQAATVGIKYKDLAALIRDEFSGVQIEKFGHDDEASTVEQHRYYRDCLKLMARLNGILYQPVAKAVAAKKRLIIVPSKYLSYVPFSALVTKTEANGEPRFLVQDKTVSYLRLAFFENYLKAKKKKGSLAKAKIVAVGNPRHDALKIALTNLEGAEKEVLTVGESAESRQMPAPTIMIGDQATEEHWKKTVADGSYNLFYFATHGVPYAEIMYDSAKIQKILLKMEKKLEVFQQENNQDKIASYQKRIKGGKKFLGFCESTFTTKSPLYGFLYMSHSGQKEEDGVLTLKEILEMPDSVFARADLAVLSACNTAVTYSPKITKDVRQELEAEEISRELAASGWVPGVDQVSLTDTFMKRNFTSVLGTLWFADDAAAGFISSRFFEGLAQYAPAESLRQAQLAYLAQPPMKPEYTAVPRHPFFWAVAAIFGD